MTKINLIQYARRKRVIELRVLGMKEEQIIQKMNEEGYKVRSRRTIIRDLQSTQAQEYRDELIRQQQADITLASRDHPSLAMKYRAHIIELLTPRQIEQKIEGGIKINLDYGGIQPKQPKATVDADS